ncbi:methyl-accepting chemotaxis protein [Haloarchaeobius sp. TZWWS8]|uniref:methyl-accepting chemotaxis protein n=1 Tax=Haloarchaeobius sp. TZWWS8 TaxID=3446121 RepID=UPI003EBABEF5
MLGALRRLVPSFIRERYALKFAIALVLLGATVGAVGLLATEEIGREVTEGANEEYRTVATQEAQELSTWNDNNQKFAEFIATSDVVENGNTTQMNEHFLRRLIQRGNNLVSAIHLVDVGEDRVVASTNTVSVNESLSDIEVGDTAGIESLEPGQTALLDVHTVGSGSGIPSITYVARTEADDDRFVFVTVNALQYVPSLKHSGTNQTTMVLDEQGRVVFDDEAWGDQNENFLTQYDEQRAGLFKSVGDSGVLRGALASQAPSGLLASETYGMPTDEGYVVGYAEVPGDTEWVVAVHTPESEAYGFVATVDQYGQYITGGIVVLIGLVGAVLGRNTARDVDRLRGKAQQMEEGDLDVEFETHRVDSIGQLYAGFGSMRDALRTQIEEARDARIAAEEARVEAERMNTHLERKADEYSQVMQACAAGDLTRRMDPDSESDAMVDIAVEFNAMVAEIESTTERLTRFAGEVATASEEVTASAEEVRSASEQVTGSVQEISDGAERQNQSLHSVSNEMEGLSTTTEEIAASSNEVADIAARTAETGRDGREAAEKAIESMGKIESESESAVEAIEALEAEMRQIDELIEFISDVAKETNMLALNANIEASRGVGGENGGDGFAVVAQQVKELAAETKETAEDIESRLERIQEQTELTSETVQTTSSRVAENAKSVREAATALDEIASYAQETNTGVQEISAATEEQAASTQEVVAMVDEAATISEETTAESENVAAAAEQQTTALTEVSNSAGSLTQQASLLSEALDRFETDADLSDDVLGVNDVGELGPGHAAQDEPAGTKPVADEHGGHHPPTDTVPAPEPSAGPEDEAGPEGAHSEPDYDAGRGDAEESSETEEDDVFTFGNGDGRTE